MKEPCLAERTAIVLVEAVDRTAIALVEAVDRTANVLVEAADRTAIVLEERRHTLLLEVPWEDHSLGALKVQGSHLQQEDSLGSGVGRRLPEM